MTIVDMNDTLSTVQTAGGQPKKDLPPSMVERMTLILDAFDGRAARLTLEEVACRTQLPRSTVHRILDQLVKLDWVDHASFGYCLGRRALGLGGGDGGHSQIRVPTKLRDAIGRSLDLDDAGEDVEQAPEHVHRPGGVLADHVEHGIAQAVVIGHGQDEHHPAVPDDGTGG